MERQDELLTIIEVADLLRVDPRTVARWRRAGTLVPALYTPGGRPRYRRSQVEALTGEFPQVDMNAEDGDMNESSPSPG